MPYVVLSPAEDWIVAGRERGLWSPAYLLGSLKDSEAVFYLLHFSSSIKYGRIDGSACRVSSRAGFSIGMLWC